MSEPGPAHWRAAKNVLRYLKGTKELGIIYGKDKRDQRALMGYSDSDFAGDVENRYSTSGACFLFGGSAISWRSKKQSIVAQSSVEAEYIALSFAVREALWLRKLDGVFGSGSTPLGLGVDNQGALALSRDVVQNERSKHIDVKYHFIRHHVATGTVELNYIPRAEMVADVMTKPLGATKHKLFVDMMGME